MIISRAEVASALSAYRAIRRKANVATVAFDTNDTFERSEEASSLTDLAAIIISSEPFYRRERVEDLRRRIAEGRYFVPAEEIVDKLLGRLVVEAAF